MIFAVVSLFSLGLVFIIFGGNQLVKNALKISEITGVPEMMIGATIVSLATTLPELSVTVFSSMDNLIGIAVGNAVGSMMFNLTFIIGICILFYPQFCNKNNLRKNFYILLFSTISIFVFGVTSSISKIEGCVLLFVFITFFVSNIIDVTKKIKAEGIVKVNKVIDKKRLLYVGLMFVIGSFFVFLGGKLLVDNGERIARLLNLSEHIIGVTIVAIGTSLPELVTGISSIKYKSTSLAIGNTIGANVLSSTLLIGATAVISKQPLTFDKNITFIALPILIISMLITYIPISKHNKTFRFQGVLLLLFSLIYYSSLFF